MNNQYVSAIRSLIIGNLKQDDDIYVSFRLHEPTFDNTHSGTFTSSTTFRALKYGCSMAFSAEIRFAGS